MFLHHLVTMVGIIAIGVRQAMKKWLMVLVLGLSVSLSACWRPDWQIQDKRIDYYRAGVKPDKQYYADSSRMKQYYAR